MIFRKAKTKDEKSIKYIALKAYKKYIERMGQEPAPMRPNIQKYDLVFVCEDNNKIIATFTPKYAFEEVAQQGVPKAK